MIDVEVSAPDFAVHWASQLGASPLSIKRLRGGINNQVFRCGNRNKKWVIKGYAPVKPGQRDRMQAEVDFLEYATHAAPTFTPALIENDLERRCVVLEHIEGKVFPEGEPPSNEAVVEAVKFFRQLNSDPKLAQRSIKLDAAEGFLSLGEHLRNVRQRVKEMTVAHLDSEHRRTAEGLLEQLHSKLLLTEQSTSRLIDKGLVTDAISPDERCVSPSDFGFHNAIRTSTKICFIDFEFAGWDDPAKAIKDFALQPRMPISKDKSSLFEAFSLHRQLDLRRRCMAIEPILRLKWTCIILAVLKPERLEQIQMVLPESEAKSLVQGRLKQANEYISLIR